MTDDGIIVSTRLRLARNVDGVPFPHKLGEGASAEIADRVDAALKPVDRFARYDIKSVSPLIATMLREKHLISPDLVSESPYGVALISSDETVSVMVNEEDHIREQVIFSGLSLDQAYDKVNRIDDILGRSIKFAFSRRFGYLTSCATNLGTGMRASVMMFLPALTMQNMMDACINDVARLNMTVRGVYGEGSKADGYLYQISNQKTLGVTEAEIIGSVRSTINHIVEAETRARSLLSRDGDELKDKVFRAWGIATNAYRLTTAETMELLATIRLGSCLGYIDIDDISEFQSLLTRSMPANMQYIGGKSMSADERDVLRARYVAANLKNVAAKKD